MCSDRRASSGPIRRTTMLRRRASAERRGTRRRRKSARPGHGSRRRSRRPGAEDAVGNFSARGRGLGIARSRVGCFHQASRAEQRGLLPRPRAIAVVCWVGRTHSCSRRDRQGWKNACPGGRRAAGDVCSSAARQRLSLAAFWLCPSMPDAKKRAPQLVIASHPPHFSSLLLPV